MEGTGDGGVLIQTSAEPVACGAGEWFPEEFLPTVGPVPRRRLVDWLLGTRPRAQVGPARVMPTWTRPTTDPGPVPRPAGGPGADGTSGHVVGADADRAHNPTTGPGTDAPGGPVEPTED